MFRTGTSVSVAHAVSMDRHGSCFFCAEHLYPGERVGMVLDSRDEPHHICLQCIEEENITLLT